MNGDFNSQNPLGKKSSPMLFNIFIAYLLEEIDNKIYSSNTKPFRSVETRRVFERLQKELIKYET